MKNPMDIKKELTTIKNHIDQGIKEIFDELIEQTQREDKRMAVVVTYLRDIILAGGKRARPMLVLQGYTAAGGQDQKKIVRAAIGIELIHVSLLIHDDIMDRDDMRHGVHAVHAHFAKNANDIFGINLDVDQAAHFGISTGINIGVYCYALGIELISTTEIEPAVITKVITHIQKTIRQTGLGQFQDIMMGHLENVTQQDVISMYQNKTARYSFENPLHVGAILAGKDDAFCTELSGYALPLGIAFQMQDDMLGIYGDAQKTGKSVGSDIAEGKQTYLVVRALTKANDKQKKILHNLLGKQQITHADVESFRSVIDEIGVGKEVEQEMADYLEQASLALEKIDMEPQAKKFLQELVVYQKSRSH